MTRTEVIGDATLYLGDCMKIMPTLPKVDAVVTDPPYGINAADATGRAGTRRGASAALARDYGSIEWDGAPPEMEDLLTIIAAGKRALLWGGNHFGLPASSCWLVWDKENGTNGYADCELAWTNLPKAVRRLKWRWAGMLQQDMGNKEERVHPTQKPLAVMAWSIEQFDRAETVLDPYMGSGTTGVAAIQLGRKFIGIEREPKYFDIACRRIEQAAKQGQLFDAPSAQVEQLSLEIGAA